MESKFQAYLKFFQIEDEKFILIPITNSHINDTYCVQDKDGVNRYIIQRINSYVFPQPEKVMENIVLVTEHIQKKWRELKEENMYVSVADNTGKSDKSMESRETLKLIPTKEGNSHLEIDGNYIRMFEFIQEGYSCDQITRPEEFQQVAVAIGRFHKLLADIDVSQLNVTIKDFHNTPRRLEGFKKVVAEDSKDRAGRVQEEIEFILQRESLARSFEGKIIEKKEVEQVIGGILTSASDGLKLRVTHNDTKPANVMLHKQTGQAICMIDLDTVMPGVICDDFGDAIRSGTCKVKEEVGSNVKEMDGQLVLDGVINQSIGVAEGQEKKTTKYAYFDKELYDLFYEAFVEECKEFLTPMEIEMLPIGAMKITYEQALRFLEDYLKGDVYFKVTDEEQNLRRARVQMNLLREMEDALK